MNEKKRAKMIFKRMKAGLTSWNDLSEEDKGIFLKYYWWVLKR